MTSEQPNSFIGKSILRGWKSLNINSGGSRGVDSVQNSNILLILQILLIFNLY